MTAGGSGFRSITTRLIVWVLGSIALVYCANFLYQNALTRKTVLEMTKDKAHYVSRSVVHEIEAVLHSTEQSAETLASVMETVRPTADKLHELIPAFVSSNSRIYGSTIAFEPGVYEPAIQESSPYYYRKGERIAYADLADADYRYREWEWYRRPAEQGRAVWSEPYFDEGGGGIMMATYSVPFFRSNGVARRFAGVVTADISLGWLHDLVGEIKIAQTGYAVIVSQQGRFVTHPDASLIMKESDYLVERAGDRDMVRRLLSRMTGGEAGFMPFRSLYTGKQSWLAYSPVESAGWSVGVLFPEEELMGDVERLNRAQLLMGLVGLVALVAVIVPLSRRITRPVKALAATTANIARGDLNVELPPVDTRDEIGTLTESFHRMRESLGHYIRDLKQATAAKERLESELRVARQIQMAMLPQATYSAGEGGGYEIAASLEPAKAVGGDLYDYFLLDSDRLCFVVGDVSDKGVPAALFMARTDTLIKMVSGRNDTPEAILRKTNLELCRDNEACMFVTLFCGILDLATGELTCASGGHEPPLLISSGEDVRFLEYEAGPALGLEEQAAFPTTSVHLKPGDSVFLYTDGVTEAFNREGVAFTDQRLLAVVARHADAQAVEITRTVLRAVQEFAGGTEQSDDITVFALRYRASAPGSGGPKA